MEKAQLLDLYDRELRVEIQVPGLQKETFPGLVRMTRPREGMNFVLYSRLAPQELDEVIEAQVAHFSQIPQPFSWQVFEHDQPPELAERLVSHGFEPDDDPEATLVFDLRETSPRLDAQSSVDVRRLTRPEQLPEVARLEQRVNGGNYDWLIRRLEPHLQLPGYLSLYMAYVQDEPVSVGWIYFHPGSQFAGMFGGATLAEFRGRGIYQAIVAARVQEARRRGRRFVTTGAGEMSRPILLRRGFQWLTTGRDYIFKKRP